MSGVDSIVSARGVHMPRLLYGTAWKKERTAGLVERALALGFRGVDTACQPKHYDEAGVGAGVARALAQGLRREQLYLQTKFTPLSGQDPRRVPYDVKASLAEQVRQSCQVSLAQLGTSYLDCLVLHSPLAPFERLLEVWHALEGLAAQGLVRELGLSNCYELAQFQALHAAARVKPWVLQNRFYAQTGYDRQLRAFCQREGIVYQSFWTLTANSELLVRPRLRALAAHYGVTPPQLFFRCLTQLGIVPLTGTTNEEHMRQDLAIFELELNAAELAEVSAPFQRAQGE
jgi:diketogulonate reductase-like aldo/keto reductase